MAQAFPRNCPRCGAPTVEGMRFCANCGLPAEAMLVHAGTGQSPRSSQPFPPAVEQARSTGSQDPSSPPAFSREDQQAAWRTSSAPKKRLGRGRLVLVLFALFIAVGAGLYVAAGAFGASLPGFGTTQSPVTTTQISTSFPYAGVDITIVNVQQSQNFLDDPNTRDDGMLRLNLRTTNTTSVRVRRSYDEIAQLILPGNTIAQPVFVKGLVDLGAGKTQNSIVDFAVPSDDALVKLTLRIGAPTEAQMNIPLNSRADLSAYLPQVTPLNSPANYFGLNWMLKSATSSLSIPGEQAARGMRFLTLTLSVDNTLSQLAIPGSPYDYARLKSGNMTAVPVDNTLPVSFQAGSSGVTGTLSFLVPQKSASFALLFLAQGQNNNDQATIPFQIQS